MSQNKLQINIISQEKKILSIQADSLTAPTSSGQITILPHHIPLFTTLEPGELIYRFNSQIELFAVSKGFLDVGPDNQINIIVDTLVHQRDISLQQAEQAIEQAKQTLSLPTLSQQEQILAEASLKLAMLEVKIARKSKKSTI